MNRNAHDMDGAFTFEISDLDQIVTNSGYAHCRSGDVAELAAELETMILSEHPALDNKGLVIVISDANGSPLHFRPLGTIH
jgi:hypothetical protein